jgi:hypothetical protein
MYCCYLHLFTYTGVQHDFHCMTNFKEMLFTVVRHTGSTPGSMSTSTDTSTRDVLSVLFGVSLFVLVCFLIQELDIHRYMS